MSDNVDAVKGTTLAIKDDTAQIPSTKEDTQQIVSLMQKIVQLRLEVSNLKQGDKTQLFTRQRFLDESTTYAESVVDSRELQDIQTADRLSLSSVDEAQDGEGIQGGSEDTTTPSRSEPEALQSLPILNENAQVASPLRSEPPPPPRNPSSLQLRAKTFLKISLKILQPLHPGGKPSMKASLEIL